MKASKETVRRIAEEMKKLAIAHCEDNGPVYKPRWLYLLRRPEVHVKEVWNLYHMAQTKGDWGMYPDDTNDNTLQTAIFRAAKLAASELKVLWSEGETR